MTTEQAKILADKCLPCPFCGERLVVHEDDGYWIAHKHEPGPCMISFMQVLDAEDVDEWNMRADDAVKAFNAEFVRLTLDLLARIRRQWTKYDASEELRIREEIENVLLLPGSDGISNPNGGIPP